MFTNTDIQKLTAIFVTKEDEGVIQKYRLSRILIIILDSH